jgi:hypothetical protein
MPKSPEELIKECAEKLKEIFDGIEIEDTTVYYKGQELICRGWIVGAEGDPCDPAIFIRAISGTDLVIWDWRNEGFENKDVHLLTYTVASIVAHEVVEVIGKAGDAYITLDDRRVRIEIGNPKRSWLSLEFPYICPCMDVRPDVYVIEVRLYTVDKKGVSKVETIGEFALNDLETLRRVVALSLL